MYDSELKPTSAKGKAENESQASKKRKTEWQTALKKMPGDTSFAKENGMCKYVHVCASMCTVCMYGWMDGWMDAWMHECMNAWMHGWMDGWVDGWMGGWMDEYIYDMI